MTAPTTEEAFKDGRAKRSAERILIEAYHAGRPIVPFLGAGVSIKTGFPTIGDLAAYLAKVRHYIDFMRPIPPSEDRPRPGQQGAYSKHLRIFGWPDLNDLNANLWRWVRGEESSGVDTCSDQAFSNMLFLLEEIESCDLPIDRLKERWNKRRNFRPQQIVDAEHLRAASEKDRGLASRMILELLGSAGHHEMRVRGDWYELMMTLSEGDFDLVDALFTSLAKGKHQGAAHVLLSKLVGALGVNLFLTLNFDAFLEAAIRSEGYAPKVVDTSREADLPSTLVVSDELSVVKLHGSTYGLRIGEKIQVSLDPETRLRALDLIPKDALILVMGFSGAERRMLQLLEDVARRQAGTSESILWMHWLKKPDYGVERLLHSLSSNSDRVATRRYGSVDGFLLRVLCSLRGEFPSTKSPYRALPTRCVVWPPDEDVNSGARNTAARASPKVDVFHQVERVWPYFGLKLRKAEEPLGPAIYDPTLDMIKFVSALEAEGYRTLWIDCEEHHTTEGVVADVIDQIRALDPLFPPYLMRTGESLNQVWDGDPSKIKNLLEARQKADSAQFERAVERIREALQRGRYVLCFDSPEAIARPQTVHHSLPSFLPTKRPPNYQLTADRIEKFSHRIARFFKFLGMLLVDDPEPDSPETPRAFNVGESYITLAMCLPDQRHGRRPGKAEDEPILYRCNLEVLRLKQKLERRTADKLVHIGTLDLRCTPETWVTIPEKPDIDRKAVLSALLPESSPSSREVTHTLDAAKIRVLSSVFRRPRSYLGVRSLLTQGGEISVTLAGYESAGPRPASCVNADEFFTLLGIEENQNPNGGERVTAEGLIWLNRRVRSEAYVALSDAPRAWFDGAWKTHCYAELQEPPGEVIQSILILSILHRRAARYYFSEVYAASHDLDAFREYIYHRVAFLRYLARLTFLARFFENSTRLALVVRQSSIDG